MYPSCGVEIGETQHVQTFQGPVVLSLPRQSAQRLVYLATTHRVRRRPRVSLGQGPYDVACVFVPVDAKSLVSGLIRRALGL